MNYKHYFIASKERWYKLYIGNIIKDLWDWNVEFETSDNLNLIILKKRVRLNK